MDLPYTLSYKKLPKFFTNLQNAAVPDTLTHKILYNTFLMKSTGDRTLLTMLKRLNFIDSKGVPTNNYRTYKNPTEAKETLGKCIRSGFKNAYNVNENLHTLSEEDIKGIIISITGKNSKDDSIDLITKTFLGLCSLAIFDKITHETENKESTNKTQSMNNSIQSKDIVLSHSIILNLPITTDRKIYDTIFKSVKDNLL